MVRQQLDDDSGETAKHRAPHPGDVSARHLVGLVGGEAAEEAGDILDQGDDGQECGAHSDTVLKYYDENIFIEVKLGEIKIFIFVSKQWVWKLVAAGACIENELYELLLS